MVGITKKRTIKNDRNINKRKIDNNIFKYSFRVYCYICLYGRSSDCWGMVKQFKKVGQHGRY